MHKIEREADVAEPRQGGRKPQEKARSKDAEHNERRRESPDKRPAEAQDVDSGFGEQQPEKAAGCHEEAYRQKETGKPSRGEYPVNAPAKVVQKDTQSEFQHHGTAVKGKRRKICSRQLRHGHQEHEQAAAEKPSVPAADAQRREKEQVKEDFAVYRPADAHERLNNVVSDVEREEEKAFDQKCRACLAFGEQPGKQKQRKKGGKCHKPVQRYDADKPFQEKVRGVLMGGKHDHKAADAEKNIHAESAAV